MLKKIILLIIIYTTLNRFIEMSKRKNFILRIATLFALFLITQQHASHVADIEDPFIIETSSLPKDPRYYPTIANGYLGHRIYNYTIYKNGLYNGKMGDSHRARIPAVLPYMASEGIHFKTKNGVDNGHFTKIGYRQNMRQGTYTTKYTLTSIETLEILCNVTQVFYAHKLLTRLLVTEISVEFNTNGTVFLPLKSHHGEPSQDIKFIYQDSDKVNIACGHTLEPEAMGYGVLPVCYIATKFSDLTAQGNVGEMKSYTYITSIAEASNDAQKFFKIGNEMQNKGMLLSSHINEWDRIWKSGSILLKCGPFQDRSVVSGLYYLLSSFPSSSSYSKYPYEFFGVSPGGLTNGGKGEDYWGHVFWDQDFWVLPALLPLFPDLVKLGIEYRVARLEEAKKKANALGFQGAMYPWESAYSGIEVCPGEKYALHEQHVTGDLIHILKQYIYLTGDWDFLRKKTPVFPRKNRKFVTPWDMVYETAVFWVSRSVWNNTRSCFVINDVMGPDEYHSNVNNSGFTNAIASQNIKFAIEAAKVLNITLPYLTEWQTVANNLIIPYDAHYDYHPEYDGFDYKTDLVKQADAIMLGFPLMAENITKSSRKNDLEIYKKITDPYGPAMTSSMFSINWGLVDIFALSDVYFLRQYTNIQDPFQIWAENTNGDGAVNFLTGIGGYLQSILYGYLGLGVNSNHLYIRSRIFPSYFGQPVQTLQVLGLKYRNVILDFEVTIYNCIVKLVGFSDKKPVTVNLITKKKDYVLSNIDDFVKIPNLTECQIFIGKSYV